MLLLILVYAKVQVRLAIYREQTSEGAVEIQALNENNSPHSCAVTPLREITRVLGDERTFGER
jgi:hypothetical protein